MFPQVGRDVIHMVLDNNGGNVDNTIAALLAMASPAPRADPPARRQKRGSKVSLALLERSREELKAEIKDAAAKEDFARALNLQKDAKSIEKAIAKKVKRGSRGENSVVSVRLTQEGRAGFDFGYHRAGWDVKQITPGEPGQPELRLGDRIIAVEGVTMAGLDYSAQIALWTSKTTSKKGAAVRVIVRRFIDPPATATATQDAANAGAARAPGDTKSTAAAAGPSDNAKGTQPKAKAATAAEDLDPAAIASKLAAGAVPRTFLRPPGFFASSQTARQQSLSQIEQDEQLARLLQDQLFMNELRNNPEDYMYGGRTRVPRVRAASRSQQRRQQQSTAGPGAGTAVTAAGSESKAKKKSWKERWAKLGTGAKEKLAKLASIFKRNKDKGRKSARAGEFTEVTPLTAAEGEALPVAPDLGGRPEGRAAQFVVGDLDDEEVCNAAKCANRTRAQPN